MALRNYDPDEPVDVRTAGLSKQYLDLVGERQEWKATREEAEKKVKALDEDIKQLQAKCGYKTVLTPDWRVTLAQGCSTTISKERLLEQGVSVKIIEKATKRTTYEYLTVTANGK